MFPFKSQSKNARENKTPENRFYVDGVCDVGCVRENNEDAIYWGFTKQSDKKEHRNILLLVADGMGGHNAGEVASSMAIDYISTAAKNIVKNPPKALSKLFSQANRKIYRAASREQAYIGMGTTCVALLLTEQLAYCAHVGDSRLYLIRDSKIYQMTEDHTILAALTKEGLIDADSSDRDINSSLITRALGIRNGVEVDTWQQGFPLKKGDLFLLCSDGLTDLVNDDEIKQYVLDSSVETLCNNLLTTAKNRGGFDNISILIAYIFK